MWIIIHTIWWDGTVTNVDQVWSSLLSPGTSETLKYLDQSCTINIRSLGIANPISRASEIVESGYSSIERISQTFPAEVDVVKLWNFFANPDTSTRNLYLTIGFVSQSPFLIQ